MNLKNNKIKTIFAIIIVAIIIGASYVIIVSEKPVKEEPIEEPIKEIDDRITPFENQGVTLEILRIRNRGIIDKILKIGNSYKEKPQFYYIVKVDHIESVSKDAAVKSGKTEILFNCWDTMLQESRVMIDTQEEQETSDVTITIIERVKKGILGLRSEDIVREEIQVQYDYKTGRWQGKDDSFKDKDGYGHYVGEHFEVWFNIIPYDYDHDGIPYWTEVNVLGTNPQIDDSKLDPDNDGIPTSWEWKWDYDPFTWDDHCNLDPDIDGIENIEEYQMTKYFADPYQQDIYIEIDGMEKGGILDWEHKLFEETAQIMIERYAQHGINVYIDNGWPSTGTIGGGENLPYYEIMSQSTGAMLQFYRNNFADERKGIFRYAVVVDKGGFCIPSEFNHYDTIIIPLNIGKFLKNGFFTHRAHIILQANGLLHEMGHSLGITPWSIEGCDNISFVSGRAARQQYKDTWGNYESIMNYYYFNNKQLLDYSDGSNGEYDQNDWEYFFLPYFQTEAEVIEEPGIEPPATDRVVTEEINLNLKNYELDKNLTATLSSDLEKQLFGSAYYLDLALFVEKETDSEMNSRNVKLYVTPSEELTFRAWVLISEGKIDSNGSLEFYSQEQIIEDLYE